MVDGWDHDVYDRERRERNKAQARRLLVPIWLAFFSLWGAVKLLHTPHYHVAQICLVVFLLSSVWSLWRIIFRR